jgi:hypothetical protein
LSAPASRHQPSLDSCCRGLLSAAPPCRPATRPLLEMFNRVTGDFVGSFIYSIVRGPAIRFFLPAPTVQGAKMTLSRQSAVSASRKFIYGAQPDLIVAGTTDVMHARSSDLTRDPRAFSITGRVTHLFQPPRDRLGVPLLDDGWVDVEVTVTDPGGPHAPVNEARPSLPRGSVGEMFEIIGLHVGQLRL